MKGTKKMTTLTIILTVFGLVVGIGLVAVALALALTGCGEAGGASSSPTEDAEICGTSKAPSPTEDVETEAPVPGEITRMVLVEGLTLRDVEMTRPEGIEYILTMLDVDTYEAVADDDTEAADIIDRADVIIECYSGSELYGTVWVTNGCRVCVMIEGGGIYRTLTPAVDTVLINAEFGKKP